MKAIEFETTVRGRVIQVPDGVPEGTHMRVLFLIDEASAGSPDSDEIKTLLAGLTDGLTDADLARARDFGRGDLQWDT